MRCGDTDYKGQKGVAAFDGRCQDITMVVLILYKKAVKGVREIQKTGRDADSSLTMTHWAVPASIALINREPLLVMPHQVPSRHGPISEVHGASEARYWLTGE
jgi:hypothetical protein